MTALVSTIWGGRISIVVDRRISRHQSSSTTVVDDESNKLVIVQCLGALFAIVYTGVAVAHQKWMDSAIASSLAHHNLSDALVQPGTSFLARPAYALIRELEINLNGCLNTDSLAKLENLEVLIQGWEFGKRRLVPFSCKLVRGSISSAKRYFERKHQPVGKHLRAHPMGLWGETLGDSGLTLDAALRSLGSSQGLTHDDVERRMTAAIRDRSHETATVSASSVAVQLDPRRTVGQVQFTHYPDRRLKQGYPLLSPWVMMPRMICSPALATSAYAPQADCSRYLCGGFSDSNTGLDVITRLPIEHGMPAGQGVLSFEFHPRPAATSQ